MAHEKEHRTIVRLEIETALRRYLVADNADAGMSSDEGERGTPPRVLSTKGGTMAIGCGCFLIRPGKLAPPADGESSPPASSRDEIQNSTDSATRSSLSEVVLPSESTTDEDEKPPGNVPATAGTADDGVGPPTRSNSLSTANSATSGTVRGEDNRPEEDAEASTPNSVATDGSAAKNEENTPTIHEVEDSEHSKNKEYAAENTERTTVATAEFEVEASLNPSTPRDSTDGTAANARDDQNGEVGLIDVDDEKRMPDAASDRNSTVGRNDERSAELSGNSVLNALLSDMTHTADDWASASAARLTGAGNQDRVTQAEAPGCTAIVFLDAPLITPELHPRPRFLRKDSRTQVAGPQPESLNQARPALRESAEDETTLTLADDGAASSRGSSGSDVASAATVEAANLNEPSGDVDEDPDSGDNGGGDAVAPSEQHPAGLGDPSEVLERLSAWIGEGDSSGCGRREVLLVCSGDNQPLSGEDRGEESLDGDASQTPTTAREDAASPLGHGKNAIRKSPDVQPAENSTDGDNSGGRNVEAIVRANDVDVILQGDEGGAEGTAADGSEDHSSGVAEEHNDRPLGTIRQIVLGGTVPIEVVPQQQGQQPASETDSDPHQVDRDGRKAETTKVPAVVAGMRNKRNNSSSNDGDRKPPMKPAPSIVHLPPSEVLLQTRPAAPTRQGLSRVTVAFPPPTAPPADFRSTRETNNRSSEAMSEEPFAEAGDSVTCFNDSVRVVVGPVIGRVSPTSAIVLVEVDSAAPSATRREEVVALHGSAGVGVRLTDTLTGQTRQMTGGTWTGGQPGRGPRVFEFEGLAPGRRYALRLSGVRQRDQVSIRPG